MLIVRHFGDFAALVSAGLAEGALRAPSLLRTVMIRAETGEAICRESQGVHGSSRYYHVACEWPQSPDISYGWKRANQSHLSDSYIKADRIFHICLGELIGRLGFSQTCIFGKFERAHLPRYTGSFAGEFTTRIGPEANVAPWNGGVPLLRISHLV